MRTHQSMTRPVYSVLPEVTIAEAANITPRRHISGLPIIETAEKLVGIVSEGSI